MRTQEASGQAITKQPIISQFHSTPQSTRMPEYQIAHACTKQLLHCKASRSAMSVVGHEETKKDVTSKAFPMSLVTARPDVPSIHLRIFPLLGHAELWRGA